MEDLQGKAAVQILILFVTYELFTLLTLNFFTKMIYPEIQLQNLAKENAL